MTRATHDGVNDPHPDAPHWMVIETGGGLIHSIISCFDDGIERLAIIEYDHDEIDDHSYYAEVLSQIREALIPGQERRVIRREVMYAADRRQ